MSLPLAASVAHDNPR